MLPRRAAGKADRRQGLRLGCVGPDTGRGIWQPDDLPQPCQPKAEDPGWKAIAPLPAPLESGTAIRLDAELPPPRNPMGIPHRKLPRIRTTRMPPHDAQAFMRWPLDFQGSIDLRFSLYRPIDSTDSIQPHSTELSGS